MFWLYISDIVVFNVFVIGCNLCNVVVCCMIGILCIFNECELCVVLGYELFYVYNCDILIFCVVGVLVVVIIVLVNMVMWVGMFGGN